MPTVLRDGLTYKPDGARTGLIPFFGTPTTTTDNTTTQIAALGVAEGEAIMFEALVTGVQSDYSDQITAVISGGARRAAAGNVTLTGTTTVTILESSASTNFTVTADTSNQTVDFNAVGITAETWKWEIYGTYFKV